MKKVFIREFIYAVIVFSVLITASLKVFAESDTEFDKNCKKLVSFGIISENEIVYDNTISRGDFVRLAVKATNVGIINSKESIPFLDVSRGNSNYEYISCAYAMGYIQGSDEQMFYPDDAVTYEQALVIAERILNYGRLAEISAQTFDYIQYAHVADIDLDIVIKGSELKSQYAIKLIIKMLEAYPLVETGSSKGSVKLKQGSKTLLEDKFDIAYTEGIVEADEITDLYSQYSEVSENYIMLNGELYNVGSTDASDFLGVYAQIYYRIGEDTGENHSIVYIGEDDKNTHITKFNFRDAADINSSEIKYEDDGRIKSVKLSDTAKLIYNGKFESMTDDRLKISYGDYVLIDNNGDKKADVVKITKYQSYRIKSISVKNHSIVTYNGKILSLDPNEKNTRTVILRDKKNIDFTELSPNDVIMYAESSDVGVKLKKVLAVALTIQGSLQEVGDDYVVLDGKRYCYTADISEVIHAGIIGTFYLNEYGEIADFEYEIRKVFGYLKTIYMDDSNEAYICKIYSEKGNWVNLKLENKITHNNRKSCSAYEVVREIGGIGSGSCGLVEYKVNSSGMIVELNTAEEYIPYSEEENKAIREDTFRLCGEGNLTYNDDAMVFGDDIAIKSDSIIFSVPSQVSDSSDDEYEVVSMNLLNDAKSYTVKAYNGDETRVCKAFVISDMPSFINSGGTVASLIVFRDMTDVCIGDEVERAIRGYMNGNEIMLVPDNSAEMAEKTAGLKCGDIIQVAFNRSGKINNMDIVYKRSDSGPVTLLNNTFQSKFSSVMGEVVSNNLIDGICLVKYGGTNYGLISTKSGLNGVYLYNNDDKPYMETVDLSDVVVGDFIFCTMKYACAREMIIYK